MYLSLIHQTMSTILLTSVYSLVYGNNISYSSSQILSKNFGDHDHYLPPLVSNKDNETQNGSFNMVIRMIAFGLHGNDDDNDEDETQQKLVDSSSSIITKNKKSSLLLNQDSNNFEDLQQNTRLLLLPLMIRMLFQRIAESDETTKDLQKSYEIDDKSNQNRFYTSVKRFLIITIDIKKIERTTIILILSSSLIIFLWIIFSIIHRFRNGRKFRINRRELSSINVKHTDEETKKLLP